MLNNKINKLLLFGGTFDPVHMGHVKICKEAIKKIRPDLTIIMPNKNPPLKPNEVFATTHDRLEMLKLAFKNIPNLIISEYEIRSLSEEPSYTSKTIKWLKKQYPKATIYLLIGSDRLHDFKKWHNYQYILDNATLVVGVRKLNEKLPINVDAIKLTDEPVEASGQSLRDCLDPKLLDSNVLKYIRKHYLYLEGQIRPLMNDHRFQHTLRVRDTALRIAINNNFEPLNKVIIAAMYHDICKQCNESEIKRICKDVNTSMYPTWHTLHGLAASIVMEDKYGIKDREVLNAVKNHCVPSKQIDTLGKIIYLADKLEPARTEEDIPNRKKYLELADHDIDKAYEQVLKITQERY